MTQQGSAALAWAKANATGKPYVYAGVGPADYDCSGLTQTAYKQGAGISLPRTSQEQRTAGQSIPLSQAQPGDLVTFSYPGEAGNPAPANHVTLYVNPTTVFAASHSGIPVGYAPLDTAHLDRVIRVGGSSSAATSAAFNTTLAGGQLGTVDDVDIMQLAGYQSALTLTPWGIPLNPLKLPGYLAGKGGALAGEAGTSIIQGAMAGFIGALGPLLLTMLAAAAGLSLIGLGLWRASKPTRDAANEKVEQALPLAAAAL